MIATFGITVAIENVIAHREGLLFVDSDGFFLNLLRFLRFQSIGLDAKGKASGYFTGVEFEFITAVSSVKPECEDLGYGNDGVIEDGDFFQRRFR
jgi:hypothetical protein